MPYSSGDPFIAALERSQRHGDFQHVERNVSKLRKFIAESQDDAYRLAQLQQRVRALLERHRRILSTQFAARTSG